MTDSSSPLLQTSDIDRTFLGCIHVAPVDTKVRGHSTRQAQGFVREHSLGGAIVVAVGNGCDKALDVELRGATLLTRSVRALEAMLGFL